MLVFALFLFIGLVASEFDHEIHKKFQTLPKHEFVSYFNALNHSWTIAEYKPNTPRRFGAKPKAYRGLPTMTHEVMELPVNFDSREQWPQCETIKQINDQGNCGSCYLFGAINSASDRTCIHTGVHVHLAEQEGDCINPKRACLGGFEFDVLRFWLDKGLVTNGCKPYDITALKEDGCKTQCKNSSIEYSKDKHFGDVAYEVDSKIDTIRAEIVKNGPVVVAFAVFEDFLDYKGGIYEHKYGDLEGYHAVRLIGFGVDDKGVDYWLLANSWEPSWGENGFFRVKRGQSVLEMEENVSAGLPRK